MGFEINVEELRVAALLARSELDHAETSALLLLIFAQHGGNCDHCADSIYVLNLGSDLFESRHACKAFVDRILKELRAHYVASGKDFAERFDTISRLLGEYHVSWLSNLAASFEREV